MTAVSNATQPAANSNIKQVRKGDSAWRVAERNLNPTGKQKISGNAIVNEMNRLAKVNGCKDYNEFNKKFFNKVGNTYNVGNAPASSSAEKKAPTTAAPKQAATPQKTTTRAAAQSKSVTGTTKTTQAKQAQNTKKAQSKTDYVANQPTFSKPYNPNALKDPKIHALFDQYNVPFNVRDKILKYTDEACKKYNIDPKLALAFMEKESSFNPYARGNGSSAYGLMQLTRATGTDFCPGGDRTNMRNNIMGGVNLIKKLDNKYGGNLNFMAQGYKQGYYTKINANNQPAPKYAQAVRSAYSRLA